MFYNIQALRGIAALLVVMHHTIPHFKAMNLSNSIFEFVGKHGYLGVDIFFVISGFVMAKTTINKQHSFQSSLIFLKNRFLRIYLGFWAMFLLAVVYFYIFDSGYLASKNIIQSFFLLNTNMQELVIAPAWSLTYELYFYLLIAILLFSSKINPLIFFSTFMCMVVAKLMVTSLGDNRIIDFFFSSLIFEFVAGYFLYYHLDKLTSKKYLLLTVIMSIVFLSLAVYFNIGYGYQRVLTFGVFAFFLVWFMVILEQNNIFIIKGLIMKIGDSSYTLYLSHTIFLAAFYTLGLRNFLVNNDIAMLGIIAYVIAMIACSYLIYRLVELPLYRIAKTIA